MTAQQELTAPNIGSSANQAPQYQAPDSLHNLGTLALGEELPLDQTILNDYDSQRYERRVVAYKQIQITTYQNGRRVTTSEVWRGRLSSDPLQNPELASEDLANAVRETFWTVQAFQRNRASNEHVLPAFGYDIGTSFNNDRGINRDREAEVFYPSEAVLEAKLEDLRSKTGFAPDIARFEGDKFTLKEQADSLIEGRPLIATGLYEEPHDFLTHLPGWLALPKVTYDWIATELKQFGDQGLGRKTRDFLLKHIENCIDGDLLGDGLRATSKESVAYKDLQTKYEHLLFGSTRLSLKPDQEALRDEHLTALIERVAEIQDWALGQKQNSVQTQAA